MALDLYCWRCDMVLPMLDETEWALMEPALNRSIDDAKHYRHTHNVTLKEALAVDLGRTALDLYYAMTGFRETNVKALHHHRIALYGPPCTNCSKPLRTPRASYCPGCGAKRA